MEPLGQHFLLDAFILGDLADACLLGSEDVVLEIGNVLPMAG